MEGADKMKGYVNSPGYQAWQVAMNKASSAAADAMALDLMAYGISIVDSDGKRVAPEDFYVEPPPKD